MKIFFKIIIVLVITCFFSLQKLSAEEKIKVGLLVPLSGKQSDIGKSVLNSIKLAINKNEFVNLKIRIVIRIRIAIRCRSYS